MSSIVKKVTIEQLKNCRPEIEFTECRRWEAGRVVDVHLHKDIFQIDYFPEGNGVYESGRICANAPPFFVDIKSRCILMLDQGINILNCVLLGHPRIRPYAIGCTTNAASANTQCRNNPELHIRLAIFLRSFY